MGVVRHAAILTAVLAFAGGCSSQQVLVVPRPPESAQHLGRVEGHASGSLLLAIIPISLNSRTERAYNEALSKAPGAKALTDVTIQENWYWYGIGTIRSVTVTGEAVR